MLNRLRPNQRPSVPFDAAAVHLSATTRIDQARARLQPVAIEVAKASDQVQRLASRVHQISRTLEEVTVGVLAGSAQREDIERLRAERGDAERALDAAQRRLADVSQTHDGMAAALKRLEEEMEAEQRRAAFIAMRSLVAQMVPRVREAAALNAELRDLWISVGGPSNLQPLANFDLDERHGGGTLQAWLRDIEGVDWASHGIR